MVALGSTAFREDLTPYTMEQSAAQVANTDPEIAEELYDFAADLATIRNLPEQRLGNPLNPVWKDYS